MKSISLRVAKDTACRGSAGVTYDAGPERLHEQDDSNGTERCVRFPGEIYKVTILVKSTCLNAASK